MDKVGLFLNIACMGFLIFLLIIYFSKKNMNNMDNKVYRYILISDFFMILFELIFILVCYFFKDNLFLIGLTKRISWAFLLSIFIFLAIYAIIIATEKNEKFVDFGNKNKNTIIAIICCFILIVFVLQLVLPLDFYFRDGGYVSYLDGIGSNGLTLGLVGLLLLIALPIIFKNWKIVDKKRFSPIIITSILEVITLIVNSIDLSLCLASFSLTMTCYLMYFTIENPDIKMIARLELAKNQAEKSNKAKSDFLSSMSHEIRTPLNAIVGLSQMISEGDNIEAMRNDSKDILLASQNLLEIVNGVLDMNKLESHEMEIVEENYDIYSIFDEVLKLTNVRIGEKDLEVRTHFSENIPHELYGDKEKIKQILLNLLSNAVKYTDKGIVDFIVDSTINKDVCRLKITVKDTGRGMTEEFQSNLFNKFTRLESDKDSDIAGAGLGLAITKSLVELFDGTIDVQSELGVGSTFTVELNQKVLRLYASNNREEPKPIEEVVEEPIREEKVEEKVASTEETKVENTTIDSNKEEVHEIKDDLSNTQDLGNKVVESIISDVNVIDNQNTLVNKVLNNDEDKGNVLLVVDDNNVNLKVASRMLKEFNFEIETAHSGFECLEKVKDNKKYNLIFMDIMMPEMNGVETMQKLKSMDGWNTPIIALTADSMDGSREKYLAAGFDEYVSKPIIKQILQETLNKYVDVDDISFVDNNTK